MTKGKRPQGAVRFARFVLLLVLIGAPASTAGALELQVREGEYERGARVVATIIGKGTVGVESSFRQMSWMVEGDGKREVDLGPISAPAIEEVTLRGSDGEVLFAMFLCADADEQGRVRLLRTRMTPVGASELTKEAVDQAAEERSVFERVLNSTFAVLTRR